MKNQYFGDINDYSKYGLLRLLTDHGQLRTGVCWMLTPNDGRTDGKFISYLESPDQWRHHDPELFERLSSCIADGDRSVARVERDGVIGGATFCSSVLQDAHHHRREYFADAMHVLADCDLVFFDPDNGLEIKSTPYGAKGSSKFLFWHEVEAFYKRGQSLLIYQHFIREEREGFIARLSLEFERRLGSHEVWAFRTPNVVFFLVLQERHGEFFRARTELVKKCWATQIQISVHLHHV